jgi:hypothetical protein
MVEFVTELSQSRRMVVTARLHLVAASETNNHEKIELTH